MKILRDKGNREPLKIRFDWKAYYQRFCMAHGGQEGQPVPYKNRLLFPDGWQYSNMDYAGPEYPPPEDPRELRLLTVAYWETRVKFIDRQLERVRTKLQAVVNLQSQKSLPLQCPIVYRDEETGKPRPRKPEEPRAFDIDLELTIRQHAGGIMELEHDLARCVQKLEELNPKEVDHAS